MSLAPASRVLALLPQTQCKRCGYADCAAYADAIAQGSAAINQCPPGGAIGIERMAALTGQTVLALNPAFGVEGPRTVAFIDETWCIGCTLCIKACPTSAIVGSSKLMHTVIEAYCTGCELCLPVCPVDCIGLEDASPGSTGWGAWSPQQATLARQRYKQTLQRRQRDSAVRQDELPLELITKNAGPAQATAERDPASKKRAAIDAAMARARQQRAAGRGVA